MSRPLTPIPIPLSQHLKTARTRVAPLLVCMCAALIAIMLWQEAVSPAMLVGEVATVQSRVTSPVAAAIHRLHAGHLQRVKAGDIIAELRPADARQTLDLMQSELTLLRAAHGEADTTAAQRSEAMDFDRLHLDWMSQKVALAAAIAKATEAAIDLEAAQGIASQAAGANMRFVQQAQLKKQSADGEVTERHALIDALGKRIDTLRTEITAAHAVPPSPIAATVKRHEARLHELEQSLSAVTLHAPMDGIITAVLRRTGEHVAEGEPLVLIAAITPERIVGYLRQPFPIEPQVGQEVEVRTHGRSRARGIAMVTRVGTHFENISNPALHPATTPEVGLPVEVSLPPELKLRPGELVSLVIREKPATSPTL
jgi:multidrug resistance efflux pump